MTRLVLAISYILFLSGYFAGYVRAAHWKAGVAKTVITPEQPLWMAGYGHRTKPAEGTLHDLWAKALYLEDSLGNKALLVTSDILGFPKALSDQIRDSLHVKLGLSRARIILNSSHTHSGPVLIDALKNIYPIDSIQQSRINAYSSWLVQNIIQLAVDAKKKSEQAIISSGNGVVRFQVNRRNNREKELSSLSELKGPNDFAVPVLKVADLSGNLKAVVFGYACHPTVLNGYQWSGDYPGIAQTEIEKLYPETIAMFVQGAGGDINPLPRRTLPLAVQYGKELAVAVERALIEEMHELIPSMVCGYNEINLPLNPPFEMSKLQEIEKSGIDYHKRWATDMLRKIHNNEPVISNYPYPLQAWKLGDQLIFSLGGELLVNYSVLLKKEYGANTFVWGYANDVMGYIPSETVLKEGGYEGYSSTFVYGLPSTWSTGIEDTIINGVHQLTREMGIKK